MSLATDQRKTRADLSVNRTKEAQALSLLQVERSSIVGERKAVEADLGPVRYLAQLIGAGSEQVMRWFILAVALLLDPAAVVLLLAATARSVEQETDRCYWPFRHRHIHGLEVLCPDSKGES